MEFPALPFLVRSVDPHLFFILQVTIYLILWQCLSSYFCCLKLILYISQEQFVGTFLEFSHADNSLSVPFILESSFCWIENAWLTFSFFTTLNMLLHFLTIIEIPNVFLSLLTFAVFALKPKGFFFFSFKPRNFTLEYVLVLVFIGRHIFELWILVFFSVSLI